MNKQNIAIAVFAIVLLGVYSAVVVSQKHRLTSENSSVIIDTETSVESVDGELAGVPTHEPKPEKSGTPIKEQTTQNIANNEGQEPEVTLITGEGDDIHLEPLAGFTLQKLDEIKGMVLKPHNWYFRHETKNSTQAYFISKEEIIGENGMFDTGLTMNVIFSSGIPGGDAPAYAAAYAKTLGERGTTINFFDSEETETFLSLRVIISFEDPEDNFKEAVKILANKKTNTLYIIIFEAPLDKWDSETDTGIKILNNILIDDEI